jgi:hypothetical protein
MKKTFPFLLQILVLGCLSVNAEIQRPNIILFLVDDMGLMDTSVPMLADQDGKPKRHPLNDWYRTPNMERLAKQGIRFSQFYAQSVCSVHSLKHWPKIGLLLRDVLILEFES